MKTRGGEVTFGPGHTPLSTYRLTLPAGLRVKRIEGLGAGSGLGKFWLDEFPVDLFPLGSIKLHDAVHYGVVLSPEEVQP